MALGRTLAPYDFEGGSRGVRVVQRLDEVSATSARAILCLRASAWAPWLTSMARFYRAIQKDAARMIV